MKCKDNHIFVCLVLFTCLIFSEYFIRHFSSDTFIITRLGYREYAINYSFLDGRPFMGCILLVAEKCNISILIFNRVLLFAAIIVSIITVMKLKNIVLKYKKNDNKIGKWILLVACYYTIFHFFYIDNLYFAEAFVMAISVLSYIIAADYIVYSKKYIKAVIILLIGVFSYQATISMFFVCVILFSMLKELNYRYIFKNFIIAIAFSLITVIINFCDILLVQKIWGLNQRRLGDNIFINIIQLTFYVGKIIINTGNLFPTCLYIIFIFVIQEILYYKIVRYNRNKEGERILIEQLILIISCITLSFIPSIVSLTAYESGRIRFSMGATIGILFIHMLVKADLSNIKARANKLLIFVLIVYAVINSVNYIYLVNLNKQVNNLDEIYAYKVEDYIKEYENENNIQVKYIAIILESDSNKKYYSEINCKHVGLAISALRTEWSADGLINYYTGRNLERINVTDEEEEIYLQIVDRQKDYLCIGDTLYLTVYHI
ncbi:MAG: glucosyltransferase domain-containing protein [Clostridia bacterium]|nr:glucosyltransferase domain-containing protein [Clostridia bacterium]